MVYDEIDCELVKSGHSDLKPICYRVSLLTAEWQDGMQVVYCVFIQHGDERDFLKAKSKEIQFKMPAHILPNDLGEVLDALSKIKSRREG
jgi:hypothetical protein